MIGPGALLRYGLPLVFVAATGCVGPVTRTVPYTMQPQRIANPPETLRSLILANTSTGCIAGPRYGEAMLIVNVACGAGSGSMVLRFDKILVIELLQSGEWYAVRVQHRDGAEDFTWESRSLADVQRMADAIRAIVLIGQGPAEPPGSASSTI